MVKILDASVALKWFIEEPGHELAKPYLRKVVEAPQNFAVPELFFFETAHVLNRLFPSLQPEQSELFHLLVTSGIQRFRMTPDLAEQIREFQSLGLSGYDASYVGLARLLRGKWITFDKKAHSLVRPLKLSECLID